MDNKKQSFIGGINTDDDIRFLQEGECLNIENLRMGVSSSSQDFRLENLPSTDLLFYYTYPGNNKTIGRVIHTTRKRIIFSNYNDLGFHSIYAYDIDSGVTYTVLTNSQVEGGLNFSEDDRIARNAKIFGDLYVWTDNRNEPRCINIERCIKANYPLYVTEYQPYSLPLAYTTIALAKKPPIFRPSVLKFQDAGFINNFIQNNAFQFCYRYWYKDYQYSALSAFSELIPFNDNDSPLNAITVKMPFSEVINDYVLQIDFCVRFGNTGATSVIQSFNKDNFYDAQAIASHNAGAVQLGITFYNTVAGITLDTITANTSFHLVPLLTKTLELAKNRLFLGNNLTGYDTPATTSLFVNFILSSTPTTIFKSGSSWGISIAFFDRFRRKCGIVDNNLILSASERYFSQSIWNEEIGWGLSNVNASAQIPDWAYYYQLHITKNQSKQFYVQGITTNAVYASKDDDGVIEYISSKYEADRTYAIAIRLNAIIALGQGYTYSEGDYAVVYVNPSTNYNLKVIGQGSDYVFLQPKDIGEFSNAFKFSLVPTDNINLTDFVGLNLDTPYTQTGLTVQSSVQMEVNGNVWDTTNWNFNITDGNAYTFQVTGRIKIKANVNTSGTFRMTFHVSKTGTVNFIDLFTQNNAAAGQEFVFDINTTLTIPATFTKVSTIFTCSDFNFNATIIEGELFFTRDSDLLMFEIFTPYKSSESEPYYEASDVFVINNPTQSNRTFSTLSGTIKGDSYLVARTINGSYNYSTEAMSPNDAVWKVWERDLGWINQVDSIGQQRKETEITWSDTFINGTKTNGTNIFQPLNRKDIGNSSGAIQKLQLTNKQQEDGTVMLVLAELTPLSAYLNEVQLYAAARQADLATTDDVIGTINALKNGFGTLHPESVIEYKGNVWWVDVVNGVVCQYGSNGVIAISSFKNNRYWQIFSLRYREIGYAGAKALCGFGYIESCIDPNNADLLITVPQTEVNTVTSGIPVGYAPALPSYTTLPSYATSIQNRFNFYDGQPKTIVHKIDKNKWAGAFLYLPDCMEYFGDKVFGFKDGALWLFNENSNSFNTVFNQQLPQRVCFGANIEPSVPKDLFDIAVEANEAPSYSVGYSDYPNIQITDLTAAEYTDKEGLFYKQFFRDRLSPNTTGNADDKMMNGDVLKDVTPKIMLEFTVYNKKLIINFVDIGMELSAGHLQLLPKK